jgi:hypothetical protein
MFNDIELAMQSLQLGYNRYRVHFIKTITFNQNVSTIFEKVSKPVFISQFAFVLLFVEFLFFHIFREIVSNLTWIIENDTKMNCILMLVHHIPRDMFVDLDETKSVDTSKVC